MASMKTPREIVSLVAAMAKTPARIGPMQGVQPNANAKPSRKPLRTPANGPASVSSWVWPPRLRKCMSRLSQRVSIGPARKMSETEINCAGPKNRGESSPRRIQITNPAKASSAPTIIPARTGIFPSTPIKWRPKRTIIAPANGARRLLCCRRNCPTALADAPKATNTTEKPITNANEDAIRLPRGFSPRRNCSTPIPESIEMYPGTRGSTHGERNEISPATNAARIETCKVNSYSEIREIRYSSSGNGDVYFQAPDENPRPVGFENCRFFERSHYSAKCSI